MAGWGHPALHLTGRLRVGRPALRPPRDALVTATFPGRRGRRPLHVGADSISARAAFPRLLRKIPPPRRGRARPALNLSITAAVKAAPQSPSGHRCARPPPHAVGRLFGPAGEEKMMQQGSGTLGVPSVYACRKVFFVPSLQRRNRRNYKLLDKNTFLHKFGSVPFALRAYLCYNR